MIETCACQPVVSHVVIGLGTVATLNRGRFMYPKARLDTLSDSIFAVAMTLLVLDVRLPDSFQATNTRELFQGLVSLVPKLVPYVLSFFVLGLRWLSNIHLRSRDEMCSLNYAKWWLVYHFLITGVPFSTIVVGRFTDLAAAIWLYAGHTILVALVSFRLLALTPSFERRDHVRDRQVFLIILLVSAVLAIAWSFINPGQALWALAINLASPAISSRMGGVKDR